MERWSANPFTVDDRRRGGFHGGRRLVESARPPASFSSLMPVGLSCLCSRNILLHDRCMPPRCTREACSPTSTCHRSPFLIASLSPPIYRSEKRNRGNSRDKRAIVYYSLARPVIVILSFNLKEGKICLSFSPFPLRREWRMF